MSRWLREPLVHFLVLGAVLFAIVGVVGERDDPADLQVVVTAAEIARLGATFEGAWHRAPTDAELAALVDDWTKEELFYREALALGLDRDDSVVRRRMRQKLEFLAADLAGVAEPTENGLATWFAEHSEDYRSGATVDLVQMYLGQEDAGTRVDVLLEALRAGADPSGLGEPLHVPAVLREADRRVVEATFGPEFADAVTELPVGQWSGPVASGYGLHLVRVDARVPGEVPPLPVVRDDVLRDLTAERTREAEQAFFDGLRDRYEVTVEWPDGGR